MRALPGDPGFPGRAQPCQLPQLRIEGRSEVRLHHRVRLQHAVIQNGAGARAVVTVDGQEIGSYPLQKSGTFPLNGGTNILVVENGEAWVSEADCPDKVCMGMGRISRNGEFIACLPNRLLIVVEGAAEQSPVDGMT